MIGGPPSHHRSAPSPRNVGRCRHVFSIEQCGYCTPRPGSIDLHTNAQEVTDTVFVGGHSYGLVPSGGEAYVFGGGRGLHHRTECAKAATPRLNAYIAAAPRIVTEKSALP
jgi:hypothetical protein